MSMSFEESAVSIRRLHAPLAILDANGLILVVNEAFCDLLATSRTELTGKPLLDLVRPYSLPASNNALHEDIQSIYAAFQRPNGSVVPCHISLQPLGDETFSGYLASLSDLSISSRLMFPLRNTDELYLDVLENLDIPVLRKTAEGIITFGNAAFCNALSTSLPAIYGSADTTHYTPELAGQYRLDDQVVVRQKVPFESIELHQDGDSEPFQVHVVKLPIFNNEETVVEILCLYWPVAQESQSRALCDGICRIFADNSNALFEGTKMFVYRKNRAKQFIYVNERFCGHLNRPRHEIIGETDYTFFPGKAREYELDDGEVLEGRRIRIEKSEEHPLSDGTTIIVNVIKSPITNRQGEIVGLRGVWWDNTDHLKEAFKVAHEHSAKLGLTVSEMAAIANLQYAPSIVRKVYHEVTMVLATAGGWLGTLEARVRRLENSAHALQSLNELRWQLRRAQATLNTIHEFIVPGQLKCEETAIGELVERCLSDSAAELSSSGIGIEFHCGDNIPRLSVDRVKICNAIDNGLRNARQAMLRQPHKEKHVLRVRVEFVTIDDKFVGRFKTRGPHLSLNDEAILIELVDSGPGVPEDKLESVFQVREGPVPGEPGMGLGLAVAKQTFIRHGGTVHMDNSPDTGGARLTLVLRLNSFTKGKSK